MENLWNDQTAQEFMDRYRDQGEDLALRVYTSRLIGADPALVLHGGGNTSVKSRVKNRLGEEIAVLFVKGSGWDLDTLEPQGLPGVQLDHLKELRRLDHLSDEDMVNEQRTHLLNAASPNPSVETLLHAFLPHKFVDHSHADAILALVNQPNAGEVCREVFGGELGQVPYIMPGFQLAQAAARAYEQNPEVKGLLLLNHGLFTFGQTARESYDRHIRAVTQAEAFIGKRARPSLTARPERSPVPADQRFQTLAPILRGLYRGHTGSSWLVRLNNSPAALEFAASEECRTWSQIGTATPDHVIRTKQKPLLLDIAGFADAPAVRQETAAALDRYIRDYHEYFRKQRAAKSVDKKELDPLPRVILAPGVGLLTLGRSEKETRIAGDLYAHTLGIIRDAFAVGRFQPIDDADLFDMEYWSLEQAKLGKAKPQRLQGQTVFITGAASGIGRATALEFARQGAGLYLVDRQAEALEEAAARIREDTGAPMAQEAVDVTDETALRRSLQAAVTRFGGLDILISN
ncbi:MAG: SDR family NAD(P)-dependent oxidoreductase, partial [Nitrospinaceae bacterium]